MKLEIERYSLRIIPENILDEVFIEEVLGLTKDGVSIRLVRKNAHNLSCIACLETEP